MEVILKKSKITTSILKQSLNSTIEDFRKGEILGWCIHNAEKFIVCYREDKKSISKHRWFYSVQARNACKEHDDPGIYSIVFDYGTESRHEYKCNGKVEADNFIEIYTKAKQKAIEKGQFYL